MLKKILIRSLLALGVLAIGAGLWWTGKQVIGHFTQTRQDRDQLRELLRQRELLMKERAAQEARLAVLEPKAAELEAIRSALASGVILSDIMAAMKAPGGATAERLLAFGAARLLIHGREDDEARRAFDQALEMMQWDSKLRAVCAAQAGLASAGRPIIPLADCKRLSTLQANPASPATEAPPATPPAAKVDPAAGAKAVPAGSSGTAGAPRPAESRR
jgi:hypothetical protein